MQNKKSYNKQKTLYRKKKKNKERENWILKMDDHLLLYFIHRKFAFRLSSAK